jgi:4-diphosphocytidyl-2-C-methyl-D-erythritol kinase
LNRTFAVSPCSERSATFCGGRPFSLKAPAKINWFLQILGKREDGYHDIRSVMQCVNLYDDLTFENAGSMEVVCDIDIPVCDNIVYKAASLLKKYASCGKGAKVGVKKNIPVGAGLGGGSSDAACTLLGLNLLWGLGMSDDELGSISAGLGSDVPFFFRGPSAFIEGKGEKITPLKILSPIVLLLVKHQVSVSTAWAYARFNPDNEKLTKKPVDIKLFCQALDKGDFTSIGLILHNDFEDVVMSEYPVVRETKHRLLEMGAVIAAMSGSGSSVFGVFRSKVEADKAAQSMKTDFCRVVETIV